MDMFITTLSNIICFFQGVNSLSPYAISFHKFESPDYLYMMEYLVYILRPYGIQYGVHPSDYPENILASHSNPGQPKEMEIQEKSITEKENPTTEVH